MSAPSNAGLASSAGRATRLEQVLAVWMGVGLAVFMLAQILPMGGSRVNQVFYLGLALPSWIAFARLPATRAALHALWPALGFIGLVFAIGLIKWNSGTVENAIKVAAFISSLAALNALRPGWIASIASVFAVLLIAVLAWASIAWLGASATSDSFARMVLWGHARNPILASLMMLSAFAVLWLLLLEPWLERAGQRGLAGFAGMDWRWPIFALFVALAFWVTVVFQTRTTVVSLLLFVFGYAALRGRAGTVGLASVIAVGAIVALDLHGPLLERGLSYRPEIWKEALTELYRQCGWWRGCAPTEEAFVAGFRGAHSGYVGTLYRDGVVAAAAMLAFMAVFAWRAVSARSRWAVVSLIGWGGMLTAHDALIGGPRPWWLYFWLPVAMALLESARGPVQKRESGSGS